MQSFQRKYMNKRVKCEHKFKQESSQSTSESILYSQSTDNNHNIIVQSTAQSDPSSQITNVALTQYSDELHSDTEVDSTTVSLMQTDATTTFNMPSIKPSRLSQLTQQMSQIPDVEFPSQFQ